MASGESQEVKKSCRSNDWDKLAENLNNSLANLDLEEAEGLDPFIPLELDKYVEQSHKSGEDLETDLNKDVEKKTGKKQSQRELRKCLAQKPNQKIKLRVGIIKR